MKGLVGLLLAAGALVTLAAPKQQGADKAQPGVQGIWMVASVTVNGQNPRGVGGGIAFVDGLYLDGGNIVGGTGTFVLGKEPMALDLTPTQPPPGQAEARQKAGTPKGVPGQYGTLRGIYEVKGDTLRVCLAQNSAGPRPTDFTTGPGSNRIYIVYRRLRP